MKVAICADIHDNEAYLEMFLAWCGAHSTEAILVCGDITSAATLKLFNASGLPVYLIRGNAELFEDSVFKKFVNLHYLGRYGCVELGGKKIGLCHEPRYIDRLLGESPDIIFHGHTHKPWIEERDAIAIINPGTLGGVFTPSTFAFWDTAKPLPELKQTARLS